MKHIYTLLLCALTSIAGFAQVVTTSPAIVQRSSEGIVITFHADKGNMGLKGSTASTPVYVHTGVIISGNDSWQKAPAWLDNSAKYQMTYVSANTWQLTIPSIDSYYGTTTTDKVVKLAFVFRNATGTKEGKNADGSDIFVPVEPDGFAMQLNSDLAGTLISSPTSVTFTVNTTLPSKISLYANSTDNAPFATATDATELIASYKIAEQGNTKIIAEAVSSEGTKTESLDYVLVENSPHADYPGGKPKMGQVLNPDSSVTFCLAAPEKHSVMIVGSWNDFAYRAEQVMNYQDYNGYRYFWVTIPAIADAKDYIYWFIVDNEITVGDPYAQLVLDPWNDRYIPASVYPDLPQYPSAYVDSTPVAVYNSAFNDYEWKVTDFKGVDQSALVIYELLIRDFTGKEGASNGEGTIAGVIDKLDYLQDLGVNAIEFLPIMEFNGNISWGYNTNFYFAPDKIYGTPDDYRRMIDEIHSRGMAVIFDIVFNQSDGQHPWYKMYPIAKNLFYNGTAPHSYSVLNDWNQDNPLVQQQFQDALKYWIENYHVDGFRFDLVKGLGSNQSYNATYIASNNTWSNVTEAKTNAFNASRVARMKELHDAMREVKPDAYFINENLAGAQEENDMAADGETNWANINEASCQFAMGYQSDSNLNRFYAPLDSRTWGSTVSYAESHDEERMAYKIKKYGQSAVKNSNAMAMRRLGSVAAQMLMTPGAHMIWQFQEFGADQTTKNSDGGNNTDPKKVIWNYLNKADNRGLMESYAKLCDIRRCNPELFEKGIQTTQITCGTNNWSTGRFITLKTEDKALYLIVNPNLSGNLTASIPGATASDNLKLVSCSYNTNPTLNGTTVTIPAGGYAIYGTMNIGAVEQVTVDTTPVVYADGRNIRVSGDYGTIKVYDISGRTVNSTTDLHSGIYLVNVDGTTTKIAIR